jgi:hypothetical protein
MSTKLTLLSRAALVAGIVATAALPTLAQSPQPAPAPAASTATPTDSKGTSAVEHKTAKTEADKNKVAKTAPMPATKKTDAPTKSDAGK